MIRSVLVCTILLAPLSALAAPDDDTTSALTFYGLRKLEEDPSVSEEEKMKEWTAFVTRASEQIVYARKAAERWKNEARARTLEAAREADRDSKLSAKEKIERWEAFVRLYPKDSEVRVARKRVAHWTEDETKRRIKAAEELEKSKSASKVDRLRAWMEVLAWRPSGPGARAADRRIDQLQERIFLDALGQDKIERADLAARIASWREVLEGRPTAKQEAEASRRIRELEATLAR
jgi:hypothetical protein